MKINDALYQNYNRRYNYLAASTFYNQNVSGQLKQIVTQMVTDLL